MGVAVQPEPRLHVRQHLWSDLISGLHRRTGGRHEAGAFLLGKRVGPEREVQELVYYDELDPRAYASGVCILHADAFGRLWDRCAATGLSVVADAHVHGRGARQSRADIANPMVARPGHLALIFPLMARPPVRRWSIGIYEYLGDYQWRSHGGRDGSRVLKIEDDA
jgi:hypothetical protein